MSCEVENILKIMIDNNEPHWSADTMDMVREELDRVYAQAAEYKEYRADTEKLYNALKAKGEQETQKYKVKFDECEAKAKAFDEIIHAINISSQPRQSGRRYIDKFEFTKKAENIIEKYESGESE